MGFIGLWGAWILRAGVGFSALFVTLAYWKSGEALEEASKSLTLRPDYRYVATHVLALGAFAALSWTIYGDRVGSIALPFWIGAWFCAAAFAIFALIPARVCAHLIRITGWTWAYSLPAAAAACLLGIYSQSFWHPLARVTFALVKVLLEPFVPIVADPSTLTIGTDRFYVQIADQCSGFEGAGLMLAFGLTSLWLFRKECRFPRAFLLIPCGIAALFVLNAMRIAALLMLGNAGADRIAAGGFHSVAGWITFTGVALGFTVAAVRISWFRSRESTFEETATAENPTATYLLPFVGILAAGITAQAASADFEWLHPIRFLAAAGILWMHRKKFAQIDWQFSWFGPAVGAGIFVIWIAADRLLANGSSHAMPHALADAPQGVRALWIFIRALAAVTTVPIAEELAFRGFLIRRMISSNFEAVPFHKFTWLGLGVSSVAFGLLHGNLWFAGILAGLAYAWAMLRRGRIGEAVSAHATTNLLVAMYILLFHQWHLW